jgi:hypothetical protein
METTVDQTTAEDRLPWHKPQVQRLVINIDTGIGAGSGEDLVNEENP